MSPYEFRGSVRGCAPSHRALRVAIAAALSTMGSSAGAGVIAHFSGNSTPNDGVGGMSAHFEGSGGGYGAGVAGDAFEFNGGSWIQTDAFPTWSLAVTPFTVAAWANFDVIHTGHGGQLPNVLVGVDESGGTFQKWVLYLDGAGGLGFHLNGPAATWILPPTPIDPKPGQWHHYAVVRAGSDYTFYYDGVSLGTTTDASTFPPDIDAELTIGKAEALGFVDGRIDEVMIFDEALDADQIQALFEDPAACLGDLNDDDLVNGGDITVLLGEWGACEGCAADLNDDGIVNGGDITVLLGAWGPCSG